MPPPSSKAAAVQRRLAHLSQALISDQTDSLARIPVLDRTCVELSPSYAVEWLEQKHRMGQDACLIGPPGPLRRWTCLTFCARYQKPCHYVSLTRDTTESDLKQRRELTDSTVTFVDQPTVLCALNGHVLILEGLEHAERNVLPILNNLLENREMRLADGRFLVAPKRFDAIDAQSARSHGLLRCHEDFRVIVLGLPVPPFRGSPLDPPLRSRFQACVILPPPPRLLARAIDAADKRNQTMSISPAAQVLRERLLAFYAALQATTTMAIAPSTALDSLHAAAAVPFASPRALAWRILPWDLIARNKAGIQMKEADAMATALATVDGETCEQAPSWLLPPGVGIEAELNRVEMHNSEDGVKSAFLRCTLVTSTTSPEASAVIDLPAGDGIHDVDEKLLSSNIVTALTLPQRRVLASMLLSLSRSRHTCVIAPRGEGKSECVRELARVICHNKVDYIFLYADMAARDLFQRRTATGGPRAFTPTPLVSAMRYGNLCVLDGLHRLHPSCHTALLRLLADREVELPDGSRFIDEGRHAVLARRLGLTVDELMERQRVFPIGKAFAVVALAQPMPDGTTPWLEADVLSCFDFIRLPACTSRASALNDEGENATATQRLLEDTLCATLGAVSGNESVFRERLSQILAPVCRLAIHIARECEVSDVISRPPVAQLSFRAILRIANVAKEMLSDVGPNMLQDVKFAVASATADSARVPLLPEKERAEAQSLMRECGISENVDVDSISDHDADGPASLLARLVSRRSQDTRFSAKQTNPALVPSTFFVTTKQNAKLVAAMMRAYDVGDPILLLGNQGTGKNKAADHMLFLLKIEREYMQLHRDTTVNELTLSPSLESGELVWHDSPLVKAMTFGRCLMVDEADKAPPEVLVILKGLLADGEISLSDGRRFSMSSQDGVHRIHPHFRVIALANRPGFPFLGNDLFEELGDVFRTFVVHNPDLESEIAMLKAHAPRVPVDMLERIARAFSELRTLSDRGELAYPYSTREAVAVARHLDAHPDAGPGSAVANVSNFDVYSPAAAEAIDEAFRKQGIDVRAALVAQGGAHANSSEGVQARQLKPLGLALNLIFAHAIGKSTMVMRGKGFDAVHTIAPRSVHDAAVSVSRRSPDTPGAEMLRISLLPRDHGQFSPKSVAFDGDNAIHAVFVSPTPEAKGAVVLVSLCLRSRRIATTPLDVPGVSLSETATLHALPKGRVALCLNQSVLVVDPPQALLDGKSWSSGRLALVAMQEAFHDARLFISPSPDGKVIAAFHPSSLSEANANSPPLIAIVDVETGARVTFEMPPRTNPLCQMAWVASDRIEVTEAGGMRMQVKLFGSSALEGDELNVRAETWHPNDGLGSLAVGVVLAGSEVRGYSVSAEIFDAFERRDEAMNLFAASESAPPLTYRSAPQPVGVVAPPSRAAAILSSSRGTIRTGYAAVFRGEPAIALAMVTPDTPGEPHGTWREQLYTYPNGGLKEDPGPVAATFLLGGVLLSVYPSSRNIVVATNLVEGTQIEVDLHDSIVDIGPFLGGSDGSKMTTTNAAVLLSDGTIVALELGERDEGVMDLESHDILGESGRDGGGTDGEGGAGSGGMGGTGEGEGDGEGGGGGGGGGGGRNAQLVVDDLLRISSDESTANRSLAAAATSHVRSAKRDVADKQQQHKGAGSADLDNGAYQRLVEAVRRDVAMLRAVVASAEAKERDRIWLRNQLGGDLDENRIVDGAAGESSVFRRRGVLPSNPHSMQMRRPKRVLFAVDVSASMARFDSEDRRLARLAACVVMLMEAMAGHETRFNYAIVGHNGDGPRAVELVKFGSPPQDEEARFEVVRKLYGATSCASGDSTLAAAAAGVSEVIKEDADDHIVVLISDANVGLYGVDAMSLRESLLFDSRVRGHVIFIAGGQGAYEIVEQLPRGCGFMATDPSLLHVIMKDIFSRSILEDDMRSHL